MAAPKGRAPVTATITPEAIKQASSTLADLPEKPKTNYSLRETIGALAGTINAALERGYSHQDVAELLGERGISISPTSLKSYLAASSRDKGDAPKPKRTYTRKKDVTEAIAPPAVAEPDPVAPVEEKAETEPAPKKTRGPRTANKAKAPAPTKGRKAASTGTGTRRKKAGAAS